MVKGTATKCSHCHGNLTPKMRPGLKCTRCVKWIHEACANLPVGMTLWTCDSCKLLVRTNEGSSNQPRRSSLSIIRRVSTGMQSDSRSVSHPQNENINTNTVTLATLVKEIDILKSINHDVLESLAKLSDLSTLLTEFRNENTVLRQENERLKAENQQI